MKDTSDNLVTSSNEEVNQENIEDADDNEPPCVTLEQGSKNRSSRICLDADYNESNTRYLDLALNRLDSDNSTDIPS